MNEIEICKKKIIQQEKLHQYDYMDYEHFLKIYQNSQRLLREKGIDFGEKEFAEEILEITKLSYKSMKYTEAKPRILKNYEVSDEETQRLREKLISEKRLHKKMRLTYEEIRKFFEDDEYFSPLREEEYFEKLLDISKFNLRNIKRLSESKTTILEKEKVGKEEILNLRDKLTKRENLHSGDDLKYDQCKELFEKYYIRLSEEEFMQEILDISFKSYNESRFNKNKKVWILKNAQVSDDFIKNLKKIIILAERLHIKDNINYERFRCIFNKYYTPLSEIEFGKKILDLSEASIRTIKYSEKTAVILKNLKLKEEGILAFRDRIIEKENLHLKEKIGYKRFKEIYNENYIPLNEMEYAEILLDITPNNFNQIKYNDRRTTTILQKEKNPLQEIKILQREIMKELKIGEWINIEQFDQIYEKFPIRLLPRDYAEQVLQIPRDNLKDMKVKGTKTRILLEQLDFYKEEIFDFLKNNGYYLGYKVDLEEFKTLYNQSGQKTTTRIFAKILGIEYSLLKKKIKQPILNERIKEAKDNFKNGIKNEPVKFHSIKEIEFFCKENNITFDEFVKYILSIFIYDIDESKKILQNQKGCWYGGKKIKCSQEFIKVHMEEILNITKSIARTLCRRYAIWNEEEEYLQEGVLYIIEKCGDLEKKYENDEELLFKKIRLRTKKAMKGKIISDNFMVRKISTSRYYWNSKDDLEIVDENSDVEKQELNLITENHTRKEENIEKIKKDILNRVEAGYEVDDVLEDFSNQLKLSKNQLVTLIRQSYEKRLLEK